MGYVIGILVLVLGLLVSIALHELGHMVPARRFGVRVTRYMVGFGPTLWSRVRGETEYGIKAIPLGGYVRLIGMVPPAEAVGAKRRQGVFAELIQATRDSSAEEIPPGEDHRAFYRLSTPKKLVVMLSGATMNLVIAVVLLTIVFAGIGMQTATAAVGGVAECVQPFDSTQPCGADDEPTPAAAAGVEPGDQLVSYAGQEVDSWEEFIAAVQETPGDNLPLVVERDGERLTLHLTPAEQERPVFDEAGAPVVDADGDLVTETVRYVGIYTAMGVERIPLAEVPGQVGSAVWETAKVIGTLPVQVWEVARAAVTGADRDPTGVISLWGVGRIAGEIGADESATLGIGGQVAFMLTLLASLNIALFLFNLIPLLPLDGGHAAGALWEGGKRTVARLRGRPRPAPADMARMMPLAYGVFTLLIVMAVILIYADIVNPVI